MASLRGLFKVKDDPKYGAIDILNNEGEAVLFEGFNYRYYAETPKKGSVNDLHENALLCATRDGTLREASEAFQQNRKPRWKV